MMNEEDIIQKAPTQDNTEATNENVTSSERLFDISADNISLVQDTATPSKPYIPPDVDLLDKKIGTFDATPFAHKEDKQKDVSTQQPYVQNIQTKQSAPPANLPTEQSELQQPVTPDSSKLSSIPLQDTPIVSLNKIEGKTLQDAATSALPPSLRPKKPEAPKPETPATEQPVKIQTPKIFSPDLIQKNIPQDGHFITDIAKPIRTYEGDVAEVMSHKKTSSASIVIAENKKQGGEEKIANKEVNHAGRNITMVIISILLLGGGAIGAYYLYSISPLAPVTQTAPQQKIQPSIVPSDTQTTLTIDNKNPITTQSRIQNEILNIQTPNTIKEIVPVTKDPSGYMTRVSGPDMISIMEISAPDILTRSIDQNWMLGVYADNNNNKDIFIVVTSNFFQNTFAGMLQWENVMADDLKRYLYPVEPAGISNISIQKNQNSSTNVNPLENLDSILPTATTSSLSTSTQATSTTKAISATIDTKTSTTTQETPKIVRPYFTLRGKFEDKIVKNKDVREFRTDTGITLFLYSFIDNNHLVIASNEATLAEILTRLEKQSFVR